MPTRRMRALRSSRGVLELRCRTPVRSYTRTVARWTISEIDALPVVSDGELDDPRWHPLQHALGIDAFGVNVFVATRAGQTLVEEHDERGSGQQELYLVLDGLVEFEVDGDRVRGGARTALAITEPSVRRSARAAAAGSMLLVVGAAGPFASTWDDRHFSDIPRPS